MKNVNTPFVKTPSWLYVMHSPFQDHVFFSPRFGASVSFWAHPNHSACNSLRSKKHANRVAGSLERRKRKLPSTLNTLWEAVNGPQKPAWIEFRKVFGAVWTIDKILQVLPSNQTWQSETLRSFWGRSIARFNCQKVVPRDNADSSCSLLTILRNSEFDDYQFLCVKIGLMAYQQPYSPDIP